MAGEYDEKFEKLTGLVQETLVKVGKTQGGLDEMRLEMRDLRKQGGDHTVRLDRIEGQINLVSGRQNDALPRFIEMQKTVNNSVEIQNAQIAKIAEMFNRLDAIKKSLESIDDRQSQLEQEVKNVISVVSSLVDDVRSGIDTRNRLSVTEQRIAKIEEKLAA